MRSPQMTAARVLARKLAARYAQERTTSPSHHQRLAAAYMAGYDRANMDRRVGT